MHLVSRFLLRRYVLLAAILLSSSLCRPLAAQNLLPETSSQDAVSSSSAAAGGDSSSSADASEPSAGTSSAASTCDVSQIRICLKDFLGDQAGIWTSPLRLRAHDALWLVPLVFWLVPFGTAAPWQIVLALSSALGLVAALVLRAPSNWRARHPIALATPSAP